MVDVLCFDDLDMFGTDLDDPVAELEQDLYHRLIEPRGSNIDDPDRGLGLEDALSGALDPSLKDRIEAEFRKDDRVTGCKVTITQNTDSNAGRTLQIDIAIEPDGDISVLLDAQGNVIRLA